MIMLNIDMPKSCSECPLIAYSDMHVEDYCVVGGTYDEDKIPNDCPIVAQVEQEPCEDVVSRKDVHDMLENLPVTVENKWFNWLQKACIRLAELPPVTPQPKTGHWIAQEIHNCHTNFRCSECGYIHSFTHLYGKPTADYTYCPNCGAKMESEGTDADSY